MEMGMSNPTLPMTESSAQAPIPADYTAELDSNESTEAIVNWTPTLDPSGKVQRFEAYEAEIFKFALQNAGGCVSRAAELLGVGRATMYRKMRAYSIVAPPVSERAIDRSRKNVLAKQAA
jgi:DNA-binding NtrC family response regulator